MAMDDCNVCEKPTPVFGSLTLSFQDFLDAIPAGAVVVDARGVMVGLNAELVRQFGYEAEHLLGRAVEVLVPTGLREAHAVTRSRQFAAERVRTMGAGRRLNGQRKDGSVFPIEVGLRALQAGGRSLVLAVVSDRSDEFRAIASEAHEKALGRELAHQEVVAREMGHRVKNLMATVTALISLSARGAQSPKEMEESLRGRILALSSVIDLAFKAAQTASTRGALSVQDILRAILAPFRTSADDERFSLTGPLLVVGQRPSEVLALVFHELTTNALKYGALRHPEGKIFVNWQHADGWFELTWREDAGQLESLDSTPNGFGTTLMSRLIEVEFGGRIDRQVRTSGWTTRLRIPSVSLGL